MRGLRDYIAEQNQEVIVTAIRTLKEELDFDSTAINHLHLAIYLFQTAVNEVLRMHSIKPHWMFALDNLVRNAVQAAITVLSPGKYYFSQWTNNAGTQTRLINCYTFGRYLNERYKFKVKFKFLGCQRRSFA